MKKKSEKKGFDNSKLVTKAKIRNTAVFRETIKYHA